MTVELLARTSAIPGSRATSTEFGTATRLLRGLLFHVGPNDPTTFIGAGLMLAAVAMVAAYLPARRGTRVDPVVTLKAIKSRA